MRIAYPTALMAAWLAFAGPVHAGSIDRFHPNTSYRDLGIERYEQGYVSEALDCFRRAAYYGDKTSQLALALMHFHGDGTAVDRATGYAWADLAAERGYPQFIQVRERFWSELSGLERARALEVGQTLYAQYGDDVAKPRLEPLLARGKRQATGSRAGWVGTLQVSLVAPGGGGKPGSLHSSMGALASLMSGSTTTTGYYDDRYWKPAVYWALQDRLWLPLRTGTVEVEDPRPADAD